MCKRTVFLGYVVELADYMIRFVLQNFHLFTVFRLIYCMGFMSFQPYFYCVLLQCHPWPDDLVGLSMRFSLSSAQPKFNDIKITFFYKYVIIGNYCNTFSR
jgi:hypothetical protein